MSIRLGQQLGHAQASRGESSSSSRWNGSTASKASSSSTSTTLEQWSTPSHRIPSTSRRQRTQRQRRSTTSSSSLTTTLGRAVGLLVAASSLAGPSLAPISGTSALAISSDRFPQPDLAEANIPAGFARQSSQQQERKLVDRHLMLKANWKRTTAAEATSKTAKTTEVATSKTQSSSSKSQSSSSVANFSLTKGSPSTAPNFSLTKGQPLTRTATGSILTKGTAGAVGSRTSYSVQSTSTVSSSSDLLAGRWGQSSTYLAEEETVLFIGGQVKDGSDVELTNDVYALNVSSLLSNTSSSSDASPWSQMTMEGLQPHAFASNMMDSLGQIWLLGGYTDNCSTSEAFVLNTGNGLNESTWEPVPVSGSNFTARRARAEAVQVPLSLVSNSTSTNTTGQAAVMLLGGKDSTSYCQQIEKRDSQVANTTTASTTIIVTGDVWSIDSLNNTAHTTPIRLTSNLTGFPVVDFSTVTFAGKSRNETETLFFGGLMGNNTLVGFDTIWSFAPWLGTWRQIPTTGDVPEGRRGHSSTLLADGTVVVMGGMLGNGTFSNDVYILNGTTAPPVWSRPTFINSTTAIAGPPKAWHSVELVGDVLVMGFGAYEDKLVASSTSGPTSISSRSDDVSTQTEGGKVFFLDTSGADGWRWSRTIKDVLEARGVVVSSSTPSVTATSSVASKTSSSISSSTSSASTSSSSSTSSTSSTSSSSQAASSSSAATSTSASSSAKQSSATTSSGAGSTGNGSNSSSGSGSVVASQASSAPKVTSTGVTTSTGSTSSSSDNDDDDSDDDSSTTPAQKGAIAGSLLGVAAFAAALGGLYAYKKRRDATLYGNAQMDMEKRQGQQPPPAAGGKSPVLPPVSSLWFNLKRRGTNEGVNAPSHADAPQRFQLEDPQSSLMQDPSFGQRATLRDSGLSNPFSDNAGGIEYLARPETAAQRGSGDEWQTIPLTTSTGYLDGTAQQGAGTYLPYAPVRNNSSETIATESQASHYSYPYLSAMHRPSLANSPSSPSAGSQFAADGPTPRTSPQIQTPLLNGDLKRESVDQGGYHLSKDFNMNHVANTWAPELVELRSAIVDLPSSASQRERQSLDGQDVEISFVSHKDEEEEQEEGDKFDDNARLGSFTSRILLGSNPMAKSRSVPATAVPIVVDQRRLSEGIASASQVEREQKGRVSSLQRSKKGEWRVANQEWYQQHD